MSPAVHVFMRNIDAIIMESYVPGLLHLQQPQSQNAIEKSPLCALISKIKLSGKVYVVA